MASKNIPDECRLRPMNPELNVIVCPGYSTDVAIHRPAAEEPPPKIDAREDIRNLVNQCYLGFVIHIPSLIERTLPLGRTDCRSAAASALHGITFKKQGS